MRGFRRAQLRGSDELFRPTEPSPDEDSLSPALPVDHPAVTPVPSAPPPDLRSVRLTEEQIQTLADAVQHLKFPQKQTARPSIGDYEKLEELRQKLLDAI
ncbi:MAG: hypothetical protein JOY80_12150 [Candidatus Dormibacteraeota bacterium]|nr:hypothetical protein [Candidatus Dormibacteraeota bacterium]